MTSPAPEAKALSKWLPFLYEDAIAAGFTPDQLRTSAWHRLFRGVYASSALPLSTSLRTRGALLLHPPAAHASHATAAELYGIPGRGPDSTQGLSGGRSHAPLGVL